MKTVVVVKIKNGQVQYVECNDNDTIIQVIDEDTHTDEIFEWPETQPNHLEKEIEELE